MTKCMVHKYYGGFSYLILPHLLHNTLLHNFSSLTVYLKCLRCYKMSMVLFLMPKSVTAGWCTMSQHFYRP